MKIGFDYWQVISHYPLTIGEMYQSLRENGNEVHIISAIGRGRIGTIANDVHQHAYFMHFPKERVHEVIFKSSKESPELKLAKCKELGITVFFDDRQDVCDLLNANGILAFKVPRQGFGSDIAGERE